MHRPGIEPGPQPWQGRIVPFNYRCLNTYKTFINSLYNLLICPYSQGLLSCLLVLGL